MSRLLLSGTTIWKITDRSAAARLVVGIASVVAVESRAIKEVIPSSVRFSVVGPNCASVGATSKLVDTAAATDCESMSEVSESTRSVPVVMLIQAKESACKNVLLRALRVGFDVLFAYVGRKDGEIGMGSLPESFVDDNEP